MTFFNFQQDDGGHQDFQVSRRWWYFLAATIPLTILVFMVWIVWQKIRARRFEREDLLETNRREAIDGRDSKLVYGEEGFASVGNDEKIRDKGLLTVLPS